MEDDVLSYVDSQDIDTDEGEVHAAQYPVTCGITTAIWTSAVVTTTIFG